MPTTPRSLRPKAYRLPAFSWRRALFAALVFLLAAAPLPAHERHPVESTLRLQSDRFTITMPFDVPALMLSRTLNHSDAEADARDLLALPPEERERAFAQARRYFLVNLRIEIDGRRVAPDIELPGFEPGPLGRLGDPRDAFYVRLRAPVPPDSKSLTLTPGRAFREWNVTPFAIGDRRLPPLSLIGGITSPPISLEPPPPPPPFFPEFLRHAATTFRSMLPLAPGFLVLLLAVFLLEPRAGILAAQLAALLPGLLLTFNLAVYNLLRVPGVVVLTAAPLSLAVISAEAALTLRLRPWRPALIFVVGGFVGLVCASPLALSSEGLPRSWTAGLAWNAASALFTLCLALPSAALILAAERRGRLSRFRRPALSGLALLGLVGVLIGLGAP